MRFTLLSIGTVLVLLPRIGWAEEVPLYQRIHEQEKERLSQLVVPLVLERYIPAVFPESELEIQQEDIDRILQNRRGEVCRAENFDGENVSEEKCSSSLNLANQLILHANWLRTTLRTFQLSATSYELSAPPILTKIPSLTKIWQSDAETYGSPDTTIPIRGGVYPNGIQSKIDAVQDALEMLIEQRSDGKEDREKFVAAVWRYRNGVRAIEKNEGGCDTGRSEKGDGTDLQFLSARFCTVETQLNQILASLPQHAPPRLHPNEKIVYPPKKLQDFPVQVWARNDDVGLLWTVQLDPVLPSYNCTNDYSYNTNSNTTPCKEGAIWSSTYPPELIDPELNTGLCSHPTAKRGYLCRKKYSPACPNEENANETTITLTDCAAPEFDTAPVRFTESGPNICGEAGWKIKTVPSQLDTPNRDSTMKLEECSNCFVDLVCKSNCPAEPGEKDVNGRIETCVAENFGSLVNYIVIRELIHARQQCNSPAGGIWRQKYETINGCCAAEYQASLAACNAMAEDGILQGVGLEVSSCATVFSNFQCEGVLGTGSSSGPGVGICGNSGLKMENIDVLIALRDYIDESATSLNLPKTCQDAVVHIDQRAQSIRHSLPQTCSPLCETEYQNTIGNTACYIGQCIEQSAEEHRVVPGRVPWTPQDEAFPWDAEKTPPIYGESNAFSPPTAILLPRYNPQRLAEHLDQSLCQILGLPSRTPPTLCAFDPRRKLYVAGKAPGIFTAGIEQQQGEASVPYDTMKRLTSAVGSRMGSNMYVRYFSVASRSLAGVLGNINAVLTSLEETTFPTEMCPRRNES